MHRRLAMIVLVLGVCLLAQPTTAHAFKEGGATSPIDPADCEGCHREPWPWFDTKQGPHGNYLSSTDKCDVCHTLHDAPSSNQLLSAPVQTVVCYACHDGTGGMGVYGAIAARGLSVNASHTVDATSVVPGADPVSGGSLSFSFSGENDTMTCIDCHSPHDSNTVVPFSGERVRFHETDLQYGAPEKPWKTSKLLRRLPSGATTPVAEYGSDWCMACHAGRSSGSSGATVHNHPVESTLETDAAQMYVYDRLPIVTTDASLVTTIGSLGLIGPGAPNLSWHNRGYVMPWPRTDDQAGHYPICQQCHEDTRDVGSPGAVNPAHVYRYGDGRKEDSTTPTDAPLFQSFPHESQNRRFLVETYDDLCLNCHPTAQLP
ncbi:MAG: hypothetical protein Kow0067_00870 [Coriobacteriia bacterium]